MNYAKKELIYHNALTDLKYQYYLHRDKFRQLLNDPISSNKEARNL